jgi:hypothetical protein
MAHIGMLAGQDSPPAIRGPLHYGRLVDVESIDRSTGKTVAVESLRDVVVGEAAGLTLLQVDTAGGKVGLALREDPVSGIAALAIAAPFEESAASPFQIALAAARAAAGAIEPATSGSLPPFTEIPHNAAIEIRFAAPLDPRSIDASTVLVRSAGSANATMTGPNETIPGRFVWKASEPDSLVFDPTISGADLARVGAELDSGLKMNSHVVAERTAGFGHAGAAGSSAGAADVSITIPNSGRMLRSSARAGTSAGAGAGTAAGATAAGPRDRERVFRVTRGQGSWLASTTPFSIVGTQALDLQSVGDSDPTSPGDDGMRLVFAYQLSPCDLGVAAGDTIEQQGNYATVSNVVSHVGSVYTVDVSYSQSTVFTAGRPAFLSTLFSNDPNKMAKAPCFLSLRPRPGTPPDKFVDPSSQISVHFSKPVDLATVDSLENMSVVLAPGANPTNAGPHDIAVAKIYATEAAPTQFAFVPLLPLPHIEQHMETYHFFVLGGAKGLRDVDGNPLSFGLLDFDAPLTMDRSFPTNGSRGIVLRFDNILEGPGPKQVVSGQLNSATPGSISGRPVSHFSRYADPSNLFVAVMAQFNLAGVQTPLVPLGSRQMGVYRHIDLNLSVNTLADLDLDVEGLSWAIFGNNPQSDFYPHLRIDAAHSRFFPDEIVSPQTLLPNYPISGLSTASFATNVLDPNNHPEETLFEGAYTVNPNQIFTAPSGMKMISYPTFADTYTWRDSSFSPLALGGPNGNGVNPDQYFVVLGQPIPTPPAPLKPYSVAKVPSVASPLLFDFRTYPSSDPATKGLNGYHVALACTSSSKPNFRVFSSGGLDTLGNPKAVVPDVAPDGTIPTGGYYPPGSTTGTPGTKTIPDGPELYQGRVDFGVKHSRVYTHYFDLGSANTQFSNDGIILNGSFPANTSIDLAYRGASTATAGSVNDARCFDAYGNSYVGAGKDTVPPPFFAGGPPVDCGTSTGQVPQSTFTNDVTAINGKRFVIFRLTFTGNLVTNASPSLTSFGFAYTTAGP